MVYRLSIFVFISVAFILGQPLCYADAEPDCTKVSELLFPETAHWKPVKGLKTPGEDFLKRHADALKKAYYTSEVARNWERDHCSFIDRAFSEERGTPQNFFLHDVDGDGRPDIIYSGSSLCAEGNSTIIWFGSPNGFVVRQNDLWPMLLLRMAELSPVRLSSVSVGCCADLVDEYYVGTPTNLRQDGRRRITKSTRLPTGLRSRTPFITGTELVLRSSPHTDNIYDVASSDLRDAAVFGNILSRFLPGCSGTIIGRHSDRNSKTWLFVILDEKKCNPLRTHAPYNVNVGWVDETGINTKSSE